MLHGLTFMVLSCWSSHCYDDITLSCRAVTRTFIGAVYIHIFMFYLTSFFSNQIQIDQFEFNLKRNLLGRTWIYKIYTGPPIKVLAMALLPLLLRLPYLNLLHNNKFSVMAKKTGYFRWWWDCCAEPSCSSSSMHVIHSTYRKVKVNHMKHLEFRYSTSI